MARLLFTLEDEERYGDSSDAPPTDRPATLRPSRVNEPAKGASALRFTLDEDEPSVPPPPALNVVDEAPATTPAPTTISIPRPKAIEDDEPGIISSVVSEYQRVGNLMAERAARLLGGYGSLGAAAARSTGIESLAGALDKTVEMAEVDLGAEHRFSVDKILEAEGAVETAKQTLGFIYEQGAVGLVDMAASLANFPAYLAAFVGNIAQSRAENKNRPITAQEVVEALPAAAVLAATERIAGRITTGTNIGKQAGAEGVKAEAKLLDRLDEIAARFPQPKSAAGRIGTSALVQSATEAIQEPAEYLTERVGTPAPITLEALSKSALGGGLAGAGMGGGFTAGAEAASAIERFGQRKAPQETVYEDTGPPPYANPAEAEADAWAAIEEAQAEADAITKAHQQRKRAEQKAKKVAVKQLTQAPAAAPATPTPTAKPKPKPKKAKAHVASERPTLSLDKPAQTTGQRKALARALGIKGKLRDMRAADRDAAIDTELARRQAAEPSTEQRLKDVESLAKTLTSRDRREYAEPLVDTLRLVEQTAAQQETRLDRLEKNLKSKTDIRQLRQARAQVLVDRDEFGSNLQSLLSVEQRVREGQDPNQVVGQAVNALEDMLTVAEITKPGLRQEITAALESKDAAQNLTAIATELNAALPAKQKVQAPTLEAAALTAAEATWQGKSQAEASSPSDIRQGLSINLEFLENQTQESDASNKEYFVAHAKAMGEQVEGLAKWYAEQAQRPELDQSDITSELVNELNAAQKVAQTLAQLDETSDTRAKKASVSRQYTKLMRHVANIRKELGPADIVPSDRRQAAEANRSPSAELPYADSQRKQVQALVKELRNSERGATYSSVAQRLSDTFPVGHPYQRLAKVMTRLQLNVPVRVVGDSDVQAGPMDQRQAAGIFMVQPRRNAQPGDSIAQGIRREVLLRDHPDLRAGKQAPELLLHEMAHAATYFALRTNRELATRVAQLRQYTMQQLGNRYEVSNNDEFVAHALTDAQFQMELNRLQTPRKLRSPRNQPSTLWAQFVSAVKRFVFRNQVSDSVLDQVLNVTDQLLYSEAQLGEVKVQDLPGATPSVAARRQPRLGSMKTRRLRKLHPKMPSIVGQVSSWMATKTPEKVRGAAVGFRQFGYDNETTSQLVRERAHLFGPSTSSVNPLRIYGRLEAARRAEARKHLVDGDKVLHEALKAQKKTSHKQKTEMHTLMQEATLHEVFPDRFPTQSMSTADQLAVFERIHPHYKGKPSKTVKTAQGKPKINRTDKQKKAFLNWVDLGTRYHAMDPTLRKVYRQMQAFNDKTWTDTRMLLVRNMLDAQGLVDKVDEQMALSLVHGLTQPSDLDFKGDTEAQEAVKNLLRLTGVKGPYFKLSRQGEHIVKGTREVAKDVTGLSKNQLSKARITASRTTEGAAYKLPKIEWQLAGEKVPANTPGARKIMLVRSTTFEAFESAYAAEQRREALRADGWTAHSMLKRDIINQDPAASEAMLQSALGKVPNDPKLQRALTQAFLDLLPETSARKALSKRRKVPGADLDMTRAFAQQVRTNGWYLARLRHGRALDQAMRELQDVAEKEDTRFAVSDARRDSRILNKQQVVASLREREKLTGASEADGMFSKMEEFQTGAQKVGFLWLLASPSYPIVNLLQTLATTVPEITGRYGTRGLAHLTKVARYAGTELVRELVRTRGYGQDPNNLIPAIKNLKLVQDVPGTAEMLDRLTNEMDLDATFNMELTDVATGKDKSALTKLVEITRRASQAVEIFNRVLAAVTVYQLERGAYHQQEDAIQTAKDVVDATQGTYLVENRPLTFRKVPAGRAVLLFQMYTQLMYSFIVSNVARTVGRNEIDPQRRAEERQRGKRALMTMLATHGVMAGALGTLIFPIKLAMAMVVALFDDEEGLSLEKIDEETIRFLDSKVDTELALLVSMGIPAYLGLDVYSRVGLHNLGVSGLPYGKDSEEKMMDMLVSIFGPLGDLGLRVFRGADYIGEGQVWKGVEQWAPKFPGDISKALRYEEQGYTDASGTPVRKPEEYTAGQFFSRIVGFTPIQEKAFQIDRRAVQRAQQARDDKQAKLAKRYRLANSDKGRQAVLQEAREYNQGKSGHERLDILSIVQSRSRFLKDAARVRRGVKLSPREMGWARTHGVFESPP